MTFMWCGLRVHLEDLARRLGCTMAICESKILNFETIGGEYIDK